MDSGNEIAMLALMIPISAIVIGNAVIFVLVFTFLKNRSKERLALIEKGMDASFFYDKKGKRMNVNNILRYGILLLGLAVGSILGYILVLTTNMAEYVAYPTMLLLGAGVALIIYYQVDKKNLNLSENNNDS